MELSFQMKRLGKASTQSLLKGGHWCGCVGPGAPCAVPFPWAVGNTGFILYVSICLANTGAHLHLGMGRKFLSFKSLSLFWSASVTSELIWPLTFQEDEFSLSQPQGLRMPSTGCYPPPAQQKLMGHSEHYSAFFTPWVSASFISFLLFPPRFILSSMWASRFVEPWYIPVQLEANLIHSFPSIRPIVDLPVLGKVVEFIKGLSWSSSLIRFLFRSWRDGLTAKSCTCRGPKCGSQHGLGGSQPSVTSLRWSDAPFWPPRVLHAHGAQTGRCTHTQIKTMSSRTAGSVSKKQIKNKERKK